MLLTSSHICKPTQSTWDLFTPSLKHIVIIEPHGSSEFQALQVIFQAAFYLTFVLQCLLGLTVFLGWSSLQFQHRWARVQQYGP
ncbi:hypothetical protein AYI78_05770 [Shewanella algae]|nr:hypothetical protein AYI78_05770 [Shewanella algae]TVO93117.1 hypothetical protein AYI79_16335 [Shewanella algae]